MNTVKNMDQVDLSGNDGLCKKCEKPFTKTRFWQFFCNSKCKNSYHAYQKKPKTVSKCINCSIEIETNRNARYCSNKCNNQYWIKERGRITGIASQRWEVLWKLADPELREKMRKIEVRLPIR